MKNANHTLGPWEKSAVGREVRASDHSAICRLSAVRDHNETDANARLISASPDLLNALEMAEGFMAGFEGDDMQEGIDEKLATIRATIAKAKGLK